MSIFDGATAPPPPTDVVHGRILSVKEFIPSSELTLAATIGGTLLTVSDTEIFAEEGGAAIITEFEQAAPTETIAYTAVDDDNLQLQLASGLVNNYSSGALIQRTPLILEKEAHVMRDDSEDEVIIARVPHRLYDALADGIRNEGEWEAVVVRFDGAEWVVDDILGQQPVIQGSYVAPGTVTPTDGAPPAASPTPSVEGGLGFIMARWTPIANIDTVTYDVYVSATSGFTPDASSFHSSIDGSIIFIRQLPDGSPLLYETSYYVKVIARDRDGSAAPGTEGEAEMNPAGESDILTGSVTAEHLASVILLSSLIKTAEEGQRVEIDVQGIRLYNSVGEVMVDIPTDTLKHPRFAGEIEAGGLEVTGNFNFRGEGNVFDEFSFTELSAGLADPRTKPSLLVDWERFQLNPTFTPGHTIATDRGFAYTATGGGDGATPCFYIAYRDSTAEAAVIQEVRASDKALLRQWTYDSNNTGVRGLAADGDRLLLLTQEGPSLVRVTRWNLVTGASSPTLEGAATDIAVNITATIGHDGTNLLLVDFNGTSGNQAARIRKRDDTAPFANVSTHVTTGRNYSVGSGRFSGLAVLSGDYYLACIGDGTLGSRVSKYNSSFAYQSNNDWKIDTSIFGVAHDGTNFFTRRNSSLFYKNTNWTWTTESQIYWVAYTWRDDVNNYESIPSPMASINMTDYRRAMIRITHPMMPMGADTHRHWVERAASEPAPSALNYQAAPTYASDEMDMPSWLVNYDPSGAAPLTVSTFPGSTGAVIQAVAPGAQEPWILRGDGLFCLPRYNTADLPDPTTSTAMRVFVEDFGVLAYSDGTQWILDSDQQAGVAIDTFTNTTTFPAASAANQVTRVIAIDGKALWDAGWRPQTRWAGFMDNNTAGNNARGGVGYFQVNPGDSALGANVETVAAANSGTGTSLNYVTVDWTPFTTAPTEDQMHFVFMVGPVTAGTCDYTGIWFEIRWVLS